jgi:transcriptional regulator with XRE-family HTH domain
MKVHEKIRFMRESKEWSQEDMAEKLAMSVSGYSKIERGETKGYIPKLEEIAKVFDMELMELMSFGERHIYLISENSNNGCNMISSPTELAFEIQKQQLQLELKDKELAMKDREIVYLKKLLEMNEKLNGEK